MTLNLYDIQESFNGVLGVGDNYEDWLIGDGGEDVMRAIEKAKPQDDIRVSINQYTELNRRLREACTAIAPFSAPLSIMNREEFDDILPKFWDYCKKEHGYQENKGNYTKTGVNAAVKFRNTMGRGFVYLATDRDDPISQKMWDLGYEATVTFKINGPYSSDYRRDQRLDTVDHGKATGGHCVRVFQKNGRLYVIDNNAGQPHNIYQLPMGNLVRFGSDTGFYPRIYWIVEDAEGKIEFTYRQKKMMNVGISFNSYLRNQVEDEELRDLLHKTNNRMREILD